MERKRLSEGHSLSGDPRGKYKSGHGKKATKRGALTSWKPQREGKVMIWQESDRVRGAHNLETAEEGPSQDTERNQLNKGYSHPRDNRGRDKSGHGQK